ncbi:MAG: hypothetical protein GY803_31260 [Chloroflexi bacterium]|nr:hypothetical protein [Chloroflexota bacterium]
MSKRLTIWILTIASIAIFGLALWQTIRHWAWLESYRLAGVAALDVLALGILTLAVPLHLRGMMETATPLEMARDVVVRGVLTMLAFTAVSFFLLLIGFLLSLPSRLERPYLFLPALLILLPVVLSFIDILRGIMQRTPVNLFWSWLKHSFELYYLLLIQLGTIPIAFLLFPAGFFLQIITLVEEAIRLFSDKTFDSMPMLCEWTNANTSACTPTLITFHIGHLVLAILGAKYGERLLDKATDGYAAGLEWLGERVTY